MSKDTFQIECPINPLSLGQVSYGVLNEIRKRGLNPNIWPIGNVDLSAFNKNPEMEEWLKYNISRTLRDFSNSDPNIQIWHINGSHKKVSKKNILWTVHECSEITDVEANLLRNNDSVLVTSNYSNDIFRKNGIESFVCPNYFDEEHFSESKVNKKNGITQWGLFGKIEKRKATLEIILAWANLFANDKNHRLNCCVHNAFIEGDAAINMIRSAFRGKIPYNINILPFQTENSKFNDILNFIDIDLSGLSCAEGFGLPHFTCGALNKVAVSLNAHAHKDYNEGDNFIKVEPSGTQPIYDDVFFKKGDYFNQGNMFTWDFAEVEEKMKKALDISKSGATFNSDLRNRFTVKKTVDILLNEL